MSLFSILSFIRAANAGNSLVLADEVTTAMRLLGVERVDELGPQHVRTTSVFLRMIY